MRNDGRRRIAVVLINHDLHTIGGQDFKGCVEGGPRQGVGIYAKEQRAGGPLAFPVLTDRLDDRDNVMTVKGSLEG